MSMKSSLFKFCIACENSRISLLFAAKDLSRGIKSLRLSVENSIVMTYDLSGIQPEVLIGRRSSYIVLAIVYE